MFYIGDGSFIAKFVSKDNEEYSCLKFSNPVKGFKEVYEATLLKRGSWKVSYECKKSVTEIPEVPEIPKKDDLGFLFMD